MRPLRISAADQVAQGLTTVKEVLTVIPPIEHDTGLALSSVLKPPLTARKSTCLPKGTSLRNMTPLRRVVG